MASPAATHVTLGSPRTVSSGSAGSIEFLASRPVQYGSPLQRQQQQRGSYAVDGRNRPVPGQRWVTVGYDVLQSNANGSKRQVEIIARPVQEGNNPQNAIVWVFSYSGLPFGTIEWAPAPPIPRDDFRNFLAHNAQTAGQSWVVDLTSVSRAPGVQVNASPMNPQQRRDRVHHMWLAAHNGGRMEGAVYDYE